MTLTHACAHCKHAVPSPDLAGFLLCLLAREKWRHLAPASPCRFVPPRWESRP